MSARAAFERWLMRQWLSDGLYAQAMRPLAALARSVVRRKQRDFAQGRRHASHPGVPVIVVGNVFVGGTGKTPVVIAITRALKAYGYTPGILSRGYGVAVGDAPVVGHQDIAASAFGDEPALIHQATGAPIAVHPKRVDAARALLSAYPRIDVLVSDDGLQHLALARDVEIAVQDTRGIGNGRMLPAGPLREPADRLDHVDFVVTNLTSGNASGPAPTRTESAGLASDLQAHHVEMRVVPAVAVHLNSGRTLALTTLISELQGKRVAACAGIGQPDRFFRMLTDQGIVLNSTTALPDHYDFQHSPFARLAADVVLVTAKDAVKCRRFNDERVWEIQVDAVFSPASFLDGVIARLPPPRVRP